MTRPHVINEPTQTYNLLIAVSQLDALRKIAADARKPSAAYLIREAIDEYLAKIACDCGTGMRCAQDRKDGLS